MAKWNGLEGIFYQKYLNFWLQSRFIEKNRE